MQCDLDFNLQVIDFSVITLNLNTFWEDQEGTEIHNL